MAQATFTTTTVRPADAKAAAKAIADYRAAGNGSNRTDWGRVEILLARVLTVIATGKAVDVSDLFATGGKPYHVAHRALSQGAIRPYWSRVQVVALKGATFGKGTVTGDSDTARGTTVLIAPVA